MRVRAWRAYPFRPTIYKLLGGSVLKQSNQNFMTEGKKHEEFLEEQEGQGVVVYGLSFARRGCRYRWTYV
jgi:hypothetical protein